MSHHKLESELIDGGSHLHSPEEGLAAGALLVEGDSVVVGETSLQSVVCEKAELSLQNLRPQGGQVQLQKLIRKFQLSSLAPYFSFISVSLEEREHVICKVCFY